MSLSWTLYLGSGLPIAALAKAGAGRIAMELPMALLQAPSQVSELPWPLSM